MCLGNKLFQNYIKTLFYQRLVSRKQWTWCNREVVGGLWLFVNARLDPVVEIFQASDSM